MRALIQTKKQKSYDTQETTSRPSATTQGNTKSNRDSPPLL